MASVVIPARRAARIPPVAAMRPELGFDALSAKRLVAGCRRHGRRRRAFIIGLFVQARRNVGRHPARRRRRDPAVPRGGQLSSTVARPVTKLIGWPVAKLLRRRARWPVRTRPFAATHVGDGGGADDRRRPGQRRGGVRLVAPGDVRRHAGASVRADYIITDDIVPGPRARSSPRRWPRCRSSSAVTPIRGATGVVDGEQKAFGAVDPLAFEQLVNVDVHRRQRPANGGRRDPRPAGPGQGPRSRGRFAGRR